MKKQFIERLPEKHILGLSKMVCEDLIDSMQFVKGSTREQLFMLKDGSQVKISVSVSHCDKGEMIEDDTE